jgi:phosphate transport system substrate-binding protein
VWLVALLASVGLVAAACGSDDESSSSDTTAATGGSSEIDFGALSGDLPGTGATFPKAFYEEVIAEFENVSPLVVTYPGGGSGQGKKDLAAGISIWAGSDSLVKDDEDLALNGKPWLYFPTVAAPITVSYNLSGVEEINLSQSTLAGIFMGQITSWDAPEIAADNEGVTLPSTAITVVVRSDGSGTTSNFSKFLATAAPDVFTIASGDTVAWPSAQAANGNAGVAQLVKDTAGAIGYVDYSDANALGLTFAAIENAEGEFVPASLEGATAALDGVTVEENLTYNPLNAPGAESYPITAPTYILTFVTYSDETTVENLKGWLTFVLTEGEQLANSVDFANLPEGLQSKALAQIDQITVG